MPLVEYEAEGGRFAYSTHPDVTAAGLKKTGRTVGQRCPDYPARPLPSSMRAWTSAIIFGAAPLERGPPLLRGGLGWG